MQEHIVQFSAPQYFAEESAEELTVDVIRLGTLAGVCSVAYRTDDASAKAGVKYKAAAGRVTFQDGEYWKSFKVGITQDETWSPTLEFKVVLFSPEGCVIPQDGGVSRAKIIDDDFFPSNKYRKSLEKGGAGVEDINQWALFQEYVKLNFGHELIGWRTVVTILLDQMNNVYLFFLLKARTYMVNVVFNQEDPGTLQQLILPAPGSTDLDDRVLAATWVGVMYVLPMLALHLWDYFQVKMDVEGHSRVFLQTCIFRKYLNYTEASRQKVRVSHMQVAIMNNTADLAKAYVSVLEMVKMLGKLLLLMVFMLTQDPCGAWVLFVIPLLMLIFGCLRSKALSQASEFAGPLKKVLIDLTTETCAKYRLIADYSQRSQMNDIFERRATELRKSTIPELQVELNNNYFPRWLGPLFIGGYIAISARPVLQHDISLGVFLATLSVFSEVSSDFSSFYKHVMSINTRLDSLKTLTKYFNMQTEVELLKEMSERRREATKEEFEWCHQQVPPPASTGLLRSDMIPIKLVSVSFGYSGATGMTLRGVNLSVQQGKMVAVVGPPGSGKATFLRLLSQTVFPSEGAVQLPGYLRVMYVSQFPVFFDRSPWENMVFGRPDFDDVDRLIYMLQELRMPQTVELLREDLQDQGKIKLRKREALGASPRRRAANAYALKESVELLAGQSSPGSERFDEDDIDDGEDDERRSLLKCCVVGPEEDEPVRLDEDFHWQHHLSHTEQVKFCLLRSLLTNPEVMVLHRPFSSYDAACQEVVQQVLTRHVRDRGFGLPLETWVERRPRTVFFTPETKQQAALADAVWQIDPESSSVFKTSAQEVQKDFSATKHWETAPSSVGSR